VDNPGQEPLADSLRERQGAIADAWYSAVAHTSFVPYSPKELQRRFVDLTDQAISLLFREPFDDGWARQIGISLASLHFTQPEALGRTLNVLPTELLHGLPADQIVALRPRIAALIEGVATGYGRETTRLLLMEQEAIRRALLTELGAAQRELIEARDGLEEQVSKRTEELRQSEERWRTLVANSPDPVITVDREGRVLFVSYVSPESGLTLPSVLGQSAVDMAHPEQQEAARAVLGRVFETGESIVHEVAVKRPGGAEVWYATHVGPIWHDNQIVAALLIARDVTEQKRMEVALRESEERWRSLVTSAPDLIYTVDSRGRMTLLNRLPTGSGLTPQDVSGRYIGDFVLPEHREAVEAALVHVFSTGTSARYEAAVRRPNGEVVWYASTLGPLWREGKVVAAMLMSRDVTERKQMEAALLESEERWRTLVASAPDVIFTLAPGGRIVFVNHFPADSPFDPRRVIGRYIHELTVPEQAESGRAAIQRVFDTGLSCRLEVRVPRANGREQWYAAVVGPLWHGGTVASAIVIARDITEQRKIEEMKDNLLRDVSHELRTPLTKAQVSLEMVLERLARSPVDGASAAKYGRMALQNVQRLTTTVGGILDLSRMEAGVGGFARERIDLSDLIGAAARETEPTCSDKGLILVVQGDGDLPPVRGDREKLGRVVRNLIENACKYSSKGQIVVAAGRQRDEIVISVSDEGYGILPENLERVFDRFFREDPENDGVGVGLPMCRTIIQAHGGRIWAESAGRGMGSTFRFALPVPSEDETIPADQG